MLLNWRPSPKELESAVRLHFQTDAAGRATTSLPRLQAIVDGEDLALLLATGAQVRLTSSAALELADGLPALRSTSFMTASTFERWHRRHPDWRVVENADADFNGEQPMIRVPNVRIGSCETGPVWFTRRPDDYFTDYGSLITGRDGVGDGMDSPVVGALGGSALAAFSVTISYPRHLLFLQPVTQKAIPQSAHCGDS